MRMAGSSDLGAEANSMMDKCFAYDDQLRAHGHFKGGEALQPPSTAMTLRYANGRVVRSGGRSQLNDGQMLCLRRPAPRPRSLQGRRSTATPEHGDDAALCEWPGRPIWGPKPTQ